MPEVALPVFAAHPDSGAFVSHACFEPPESGAWEMDELVVVATGAVEPERTSEGGVTDDGYSDIVETAEVRQYADDLGYYAEFGYLDLYVGEPTGL